ncbi:helix-turn-helix domain-containing protein [Paraburkholderia sp. SIMBA_027]|uniref:helix-turn-helix domain-containing protein n=1 Tax=Paraburkholderia sp. SIMBA_027 TaxID=3085770 RepID=UPI0039781315
MAAKPKTCGGIAAAVHQAASDLHKVGVITDARMAKYNALCLKPVPSYDSAGVLALRKRRKLSQAVLAGAINTSIATVRCWEAGLRKPNGTASKLLHLLEKKGLEAVV